MVFSSWEYLAFFLIVLVFMAVTRNDSIKKLFLLAASYFFYAFWDYRFVALMFAMSAFNYLVGAAIYRTEDEGRRKSLVWISVVFSLGTLAIFKYFNFFVDNANLALTGTGFSIPLVAIILPVGISFITFEVMSYVIDIYRRTMPPAKSFVDLAILVAFFPHLIAGPILKPFHFLPQLERSIVVTSANLSIGLQIFLFGLVKKILIADRLAPFVDGVFASPTSFDSLTVWLAVVAYSLQIYCDFSGYSDMAIGSARCLGFEIPRNFNMPYISSSITEFWRRWHISLSTWLREYLYISLGGNRVGTVKQYRNLLVTMLLGGLWHGASWNFVLWGGLHGVALVIHKKWSEAYPAVDASIWRTGGGLLATYVFVCFTWVFFRSPDFGTSLSILSRMVWPTAGTSWLFPDLLVIIPVVALAHWLGRVQPAYPQVRLISFHGAFVASVATLAVIYFAPEASAPFIYFQF